MTTVRDMRRGRGSALSHPPTRAGILASLPGQSYGSATATVPEYPAMATAWSESPFPEIEAVPTSITIV